MGNERGVRMEKGGMASNGARMGGQSHLSSSIVEEERVRTDTSRCFKQK